MLIENETLIRLPFDVDENDLAIDYFIKNKNLVIKKIIKMILERYDNLYEYYKRKHKVVVTVPSIDEGQPILSFIGWVPKIILAQINTHRTLSKNAGSSRAISNKMLIRNAIENPYIPIFTREQKGMQGVPIKKSEVKKLLQEHLSILHYVVKKIHKNDVLHKQNINRYLEPFILVPVVITGTLTSYNRQNQNTAWQNFIYLRKNHSAQFEIQHVAQTVHTAVDLLHMFSKDNIEIAYNYNLESVSSVDIEQDHFITIRRGEVHIPKNNLSKDYVNYIKQKIINKEIEDMAIFGEIARISSLTYKSDTEERNIDLTKRLLREKHMSPFEHIAIFSYGQSHYNLLDWKSVRYILEQEFTYLS